MLSAEGVGQTVVTVTTDDGSYTDTCEVTVTAAAVPVTGVEVSPESVSLEVGDSQALSVTILPANATNQGISWSSGDATVATVGAGNMLSAVAVGQTVVTVTTDDGSYTDTCEVTVTAAAVPVTGVEVSPESVSLEVGDSQALSVTILPNNATNQGVSWSSDDEAVATVGAGNMLSAEGVGQTVVTVTTDDGSYTDTCDVTVTAATVDVTGVTLDEDDVSLEVGETQQLTATVIPDTATNKAVSWSSDDETVATVSASGLVTAVGVGGPTPITVTTDDGSYTDTCDVTVTAASNTWTVYTIDDPVDPDSTTVGYYTSIAVDASNHVHISYYDYGTYDLKYATNASGDWEYMAVDEEGTVGWYSSLAIGLDGYSVHICYHYHQGGEDQGLKYALKLSAGDDWQIDWVDQRDPLEPEPTWGANGVIAMVPDVSEPIGLYGEAHMLYQNYHMNEGATIKHAGGTFGDWIYYPSPMPGLSYDVRRFPSMAVRHLAGGEYELHVVFPIYTPSPALLYTCYSSSDGSWLPVETIATLVNVPQENALFTNHDVAVDQDGNVHVSCFDPEARNLFYQYRDADTGEWLVQPSERIWVEEPISQYVGQYNSIAVDSDGDPHISYYYNLLSQKGPRHATCDLDALKADTGTEWTIERVADGGGAYTSIAIDSDDNIHISYCKGGAAGDLMYATTAE